MKPGLFTISLCLLCVHAAFAQQAGVAGISGIVQDASGASVPALT